MRRSCWRFRLRGVWGDASMLNSSAPYEINVQFVDDDRIDRMFFDVPLKFIPSPGDGLNVIKDGFTYFLSIEDVTHLVDYRHLPNPLHSVTITAKCEKIRAPNN
jgi:hypothetical protein